MPTFEYTCGACEHTWEEFHKIDNRLSPLEQPCARCGMLEEVKLTIGKAPPIADPVRLGRVKPPAGFNEVLRNISKISPDNTMKIRD